MRIKILLNARPLLGSLTGIGRYSYEVFKGLDKEKFDPFFDYGFISQDIILPDNKKEVSFLDKIKSSILKIMKFFFSFLPIALKSKIRNLLRSGNIDKSKELNFDIYFQPNFIPLDANATFYVSCVHDLSFIKFKDFHPKDRMDFFEKVFFKDIVKASKIITVSNTVKKEIMEELKIDEDKIEVIYNGYDDKIFYPKNINDQESIKSKYLLKKNFILFVGSIEPRKNLKTLIKAYNILDKSLQDKFDLVIVGAKGWQNSDIHGLIKQNKNIKFLGYIDDDNLSVLYSSATVFVYPSVYEGFGIPPLEAMACGCPVILSDIEVFREIYKDNVIFFDAINENDLKEKLFSLLSDIDLREKLSKSGLCYCKNFSWTKSAKEHSDLFLRLATQ